MKRIIVIICFILVYLSLGNSLFAEPEEAFMGFSLELVQPFYSFEISETLFMGINTRMKFTKSLGASLGIYFLKTTNFGYTSF